MKCLMDQTTPNGSSSIMLYQSSTVFRNRDKKTTVCQPFGVLCSNAQPKPLQEASHFIIVSKSRLKCLFSVVSAIFFFISLNYSSCSSVQRNFVFFLKERSKWKTHLRQIGYKFSQMMN